jgi:ribosomal protein S21
LKRKQKQGRSVVVEHDNIDKAIRRLRRIVVENNIMKECNEHVYFVKPSIKNRKKKSLRKWKANLWLE